jgi:hypothetical protein
MYAIAVFIYFLLFKCHESYKDKFGNLTTSIELQECPL